MQGCATLLVINLLFLICKLNSILKDNFSQGDRLSLHTQKNMLGNLHGKGNFWGPKAGNGRGQNRDVVAAERGRGVGKLVGISDNGSNLDTARPVFLALPRPCFPLQLPTPLLSPKSKGLLCLYQRKSSRPLRAL